MHCRVFHQVPQFGPLFCAVGRLGGIDDDIVILAFIDLEQLLSIVVAGTNEVMKALAEVGDAELELKLSHRLDQQS